jgi:adenine-specific DNA methylase
MIPKECKRLAEVDFPIAVVSKHSAREKSIRHGHPSTLHLWWARRPLAACRAMLLALLLPDPCDKHCPAEFKKNARALLAKVQGHIDPDDKGLREALLGFIGDFADWDNSSHPTYLEVGRGLVHAAHPEEPPLVVDPFAGGGSIPLEALRLGCEAFASDLNPVACLILKVLLEDIPRYANAEFRLMDDKGKEVVVHGLADALRHVGRQIKEAAEKELAEFYPPDPDGARPIAYLWARTVRCEAPNCGAEIPLARSFWLSKKASRKRALLYHVVRPRGDVPRVEFEVFEPKKDGDVQGGTVSRAKATCPACGTVLMPDRVRAQLAAQRGGADAKFDAKGNRTGGALLLAVVSTKSGETGRRYRAAAPRDYAAVYAAAKAIEKVAAKKLPGGLSPVPDEPSPTGGGSGAGRAFSIQKYGMMTWGDLFTARQKLALVTLRGVINDTARSNGTPVLLACAFSRVAMSDMSCTRWNAVAEKMQHTFGRQVLPIVWDFAEVAPMANAPGNWDSGHELICDVVERFPPEHGTGQAQLADARQSPLPEESCGVWFTDPPYYDAIPYSDLSDFFFVWLKRTLPGHPSLKDPFDPANPLTPKTREAVQDETREFEGRPKDRAFFEDTMAKAFAEGRRVLREDGVASVVFAHKTTEGWEALLSGMIRGGWVITGSWPIATEMGSRLRARESAALATSIHLVCRPRTEDEVGDWTAVLRELPERVGQWIERLQTEGIRGADLVFACIGPALEIYSRYAKVEDAEGREIPLGGDPESKEPHKRGFLAYVWETVGRVALQSILGTAEAKARNGAAGALEEDARLTALFLWTLQSTNGGSGFQPEDNGQEDEEGEEDDTGRDAGATKKAKGLSLIYDVARRFAQPLGIHLEAWEGRIIETDKGVVRLIPVLERGRQLFGDQGAAVAAGRIEEAAKRTPQEVFGFMHAVESAAPQVRGRGGRRKQAEPGDVSDEHLHARHEATTLDRVHAAMLLQAGGRANALRALLKAEVDRSPDFLRLANALSALYPAGSDEKRLLDAMLLAVPR